MTKFRVALISFGVSRGKDFFNPVYKYSPTPALYYIESPLQAAGHRTLVVDQAVQDLTDDEVLDAVRAFAPDVALFTQLATTRKLVRWASDELAESCIVGIGGHDPTFHALQLTKDDFQEQYAHADFVWQGEADSGLVEFLADFQPMGRPERVNNLAHRVLDLDQLPVPRHDNYPGTAGFLITSRGCLKFGAGCEFCTTPQFYRDGFRARSPEHVRTEIEQLHHAGKSLVHIYDDNFLGFSERDLMRGIEILRIFREYGLRVTFMAIVDQLLRIERMGLQDELRDVVAEVFIGIENGGQAALEQLGKKFGPKKYVNKSARAMDIITASGASIYPGYINFYPEVTAAELASSAAFLRDNHTMAAYFRLFVKDLELYEGTPLFDSYASAPPDGVELREGERGYQYGFSEPGINELYGFLRFYAFGHAVVPDFLLYWGSLLIAASDLHDTTDAADYRELRESVNATNYNFFIEMLDISSQRNSFYIQQMVLRLAEFQKATARAGRELLPLLIRLHDHGSFQHPEFRATLDRVPVAPEAPLVVGNP